MSEKWSDHARLLVRCDHDFDSQMLRITVKMALYRNLNDHICRFQIDAFLLARCMLFAVVRE
jgi:hypothetical protein